MKFLQKVTCMDFFFSLKKRFKNLNKNLAASDFLNGSLDVILK